MPADEPRQYDDRDRSRSPEANNGGDRRDRSASPRRDRERERERERDDDTRYDLLTRHMAKCVLGSPKRSGPPPSVPPEDEEEARNSGSNLFVTGIHPRLTEADVSALFSKYGEVEKCDIMRDPHTKESRGFGFVSMVGADAADAAKEGLQGEVHEGRTLSIEKARRSKPRQPTPGRYFGPPKRKPERSLSTRLTLLTQIRRRSPHASPWWRTLRGPLRRPPRWIWYDSLPEL